MMYHERKSPRIPGFDYSSNHFYFITICTHDKKCIFGNPHDLNYNGKVANELLYKIPVVYPQVIVDKCVVMPNHIHAIIGILQSDNEVHAPDLTHIVGQYKMSVTKAIRKMNPAIEVWQRSFHDHVIRNQTDYQKIWEYIENNPKKWEDDCFYQTYTIL